MSDCKAIVAYLNAQGQIHIPETDDLTCHTSDYPDVPTIPNVMVRSTRIDTSSPTTPIFHNHGFDFFLQTTTDGRGNTVTTGTYEETQGFCEGRYQTNPDGSKTPHRTQCHKPEVVASGLFNPDAIAKAQQMIGKE